MDSSFAMPSSNITMKDQSMANTPYILSPWNNFNKVWTSIMGYPADEFRFVPGKTPMSTFGETVAMIVLYLVVIFGGREFMRNRAPLKLNGLFMIHNFILTAISGSLLVLFIQQLLPTLWRHGLYENICGASGWTPQLVTLYYVCIPGRTSGIFELILNSWTTWSSMLSWLIPFSSWLRRSHWVSQKFRDPCLPLIKNVALLHCYHHPATALLCYTQLIGHTSVSWVPITLNLMVHVVMYWYYFQSARGIRVTWKEWITRLQISQFVIDLGKLRSLLRKEMNRTAS